jgi:crossover junction endodeoxyribonuclease RuvC
MTIILGIDPGSRIMGYGLIKETNHTIEYLDSGCIRTNVNAELSEKLLQIYNGVCELMERYSPSEVAIEQVFMHENACCLS